MTKRQKLLHLMKVLERQSEYSESQIWIDTSGPGVCLRDCFRVAGIPANGFHPANKIHSYPGSGKYEYVRKKKKVL